MAGPINYGINIKDPMQGYMEGLKTGIAQQELDLRRQQVEMQRQSMPQQLEQQQRMAQDFMALSKSPTTEGITQLMIRYPEMADKLKAASASLDPIERENRTKQSIPVYAALQNDDPEQAATILTSMADAYERSGMKQEALKSRQFADLVKSSPQTARAMAGMTLAANMGVDKFATTFKEIGEQRRAEELQPFAIEEKKASTIDRLARLGLDRDKLNLDIETKKADLLGKADQIDTDARKIINEAAGKSVESESLASRTLDLASKFDKARSTSGAAGKWTESWKALTGQQDAVSLLKGEYSRLRNAEAVRNLPPGAASDKDVMLAMQGFPDENADPNTISSFLRGVGKLQLAQAYDNEARAEWAAQNNSLGRARKPFEVFGVEVNKGMTYPQFARQYVDKMVKARLGAEIIDKELQAINEKLNSMPPSGGQ